MSRPEAVDDNCNGTNTTQRVLKFSKRIEDLQRQLREVTAERDRLRQGSGEVAQELETLRGLVKRRDEALDAAVKAEALAQQHARGAVDAARRAEQNLADANRKIQDLSTTTHNTSLVAARAESDRKLLGEELVRVKQDDERAAVVMADDLLELMGRKRRARFRALLFDILRVAISESATTELLAKLEDS